LISSKNNIVKVFLFFKINSQNLFNHTQGISNVFQLVQQ